MAVRKDCEAIFMNRATRDVLGLLLLASLGASLASIANAQQAAPRVPVPLVQEHKTIHVSPHVYVIPDGRVNLVPNIGFIVGARATLVVDAGMGPKNGATVLHELASVSKNATVYLTTTHFHPEHVTGAQAFPASAIIIRNEVQQDEVVKKQPERIDNFSKRSPEIKALLQDVKPRPPDILFDRDLKLDLGGVTAHLFWRGPGHTKGDTYIVVEEDGVLFTGDVIVNRFFPIMPDAESSGMNWLAVLDDLEAMHPRIVVPGHGEAGDASLFGKERDYLRTVQSRVIELKKQGVSSEEVAKVLAKEIRAKYPDWDNPEWIPVAAERFYAEAN
jgi:glyoxylase-like metal-dependent hydrolase (beta-lactamase superfamily II)